MEPDCVLKYHGCTAKLVNIDDGRSVSGYRKLEVNVCGIFCIVLVYDGMFTVFVAKKFIYENISVPVEGAAKVWSVSLSSARAKFR